MSLRLAFAGLLAGVLNPFSFRQSQYLRRGRALGLLFGLSCIVLFAALAPANARDPYGLLTNSAYCWQRQERIRVDAQWTDALDLFSLGLSPVSHPGTYFVDGWQSGTASSDGHIITVSDKARLVRVPCPPPLTFGTRWVGINAGFATGTGNFQEAGGNTTFSTSGGTVGATFGFGARFGRNKLGVESDINWANFNGSSTANCAVGCGVTNHWFGTVRPLFGVQVTDTGIIPYVTAGLAFGNVTATVNGFPGVSETKVGWTAGGGVAFPLGQWAGGRLVGKVEFLHLDLGSVQCMPATCGGTADVRSTQEIVRGGINLSF